MKRCRLGEKVFTLAGLIVFLLLFLSNYETAAMTPPSAPGQEKIIFLHHSTGACVYYATSGDSYWNPATWGPNRIPLKLSEYNTNHGTQYSTTDVIAHPDIHEYAFQFGDQDHYQFYNLSASYNLYPDSNYGNTAAATTPPTGYERNWSNYPFDYYDLWVGHKFKPYWSGITEERPLYNDQYLGQWTIEHWTANYDVVIFKHCYPVAQISADTGFPDITSSVKRLENYKLQYNALKEKMHQYPNTKFIVWTLATMTQPVLSVSQADRGRTFVDWVKNVWDEPNDNIYIWNFYDIETGGSAPENKFMLDSYAVSPTSDCHPNATFSNDIAAPDFFNRIIEVLQANHAPYAEDQSATTSANTAVNITLAATDADGNPLSYSIAFAPAHGALTGSGANRTYTPSINYVGSDSFTFKANDGLIDSNTATISITVTAAVNHAPVAQNQSVTTNEDTAKAITLAATDEDGNPLTYSIVTAPAHGSLTGSGANKTYTPSANYSGADSFTFKANDGTADSNTATVSITVTSVNDAPLISVGPTATPNPVTLPGTASVSVTANDADGGALTYTWEKVSGSGTVGFSPNGTTGSATSVAIFSAAGSYVLKVHVNDGSLETTGQVTVTVNETTSNLRIISLTGSGVDNGYQLRNADGSAWGNTSQFALQWSMKYSEDFTVYIDAQTNAGHRYITYTPVDTNGLGTGEYVRYGLGTGARDGQWHTFTRDLQADITGAQPGVTIASINAFMIRGSGKLDDIKLKNPAAETETIYEDAEDGSTAGWSIYDSVPAGALISNELLVTPPPPPANLRVISLTGSGMDNGYQLRKADGSAWGNTSQFTIQWSMKYSESFTVYIDAQTDAGHRYITYNPIDTNGLGAGEYVRYGLGTGARDGQWHTFTRDLQADITGAQPGVTIASINAFMIRGSGKLDDIKLKNPAAETETIYEDAEDGSTAGWSIYDADPTGAVIANELLTPPPANLRIISLTGSGVDNGYQLRNADGSAWGNTSQFTAQWSMKYSENFTVYIDAQTNAGHRYITYTPVDTNGLGAGEYVRYGLGTIARDGQWHTFTRDLQADITGAQPGVTIASINAFMIRGSGKLDDIKLKNPATGTETVYEDAEDSSTAGWSIYDSDPTGAVIANELY